MTKDDWILFAILGVGLIPVVVILWVGLIPVVVIAFFYGAAECVEIVREMKRKRHD